MDKLEKLVQTLSEANILANDLGLTNLVHNELGLDCQEALSDIQDEVASLLSDCIELLEAAE